MTVYITNEEYRRQKAALTRAENSGDPLKVLAAIERVLREWDGKAWPDDWHRWRIALDDAYYQFLRAESHYDERPEIIERFHAAHDTLI